MNLRNSEEMHERIIRDFMDLIILKELGNGGSMGGYGIIILFRRKFHMLLPPGSLYSMLHSMERKGLIESIVNDGKKVYKLTEKGKEKIQNTTRNLDNILSLIKCVFGEESLSKLL